MLFKWDFSYSFAPVDEILTDTMLSPCNSQASYIICVYGWCTL